MLLTPENSKCGKNQAIVVSKDKGTRREHRATNPQRKFDLRHYNKNKMNNEEKRNGII